jgi:NTP pyrophosphatase (non-canonical NTP hydrolase)
MDKAIEQALKTWYPEDHPLHFEPLHPALGLAGEAGELLDLYKKERFKDGVSWWDCKHCGHPHKSHVYRDGDFHHCSESVRSQESDIQYDCHCDNHTPKILDELGDLWYYLRILAYQRNIKLKQFELIELGIDKIKNIFCALSRLNWQAGVMLHHLDKTNQFATNNFLNVYEEFHWLLGSLDFTLDQVTESNWQKLKDGDNHGWLTARKSP